MNSLKWDTHYKASFESPDIGDSVWLSADSESICCLVDIIEKKEENLIGKVVSVIPGLLSRYNSPASMPMISQGEQVSFRIHNIQE
ncbi:hypothetical protein [Dongshaea marina]|uniref:hypothetical protein n=1 Tax=Dongshaea marina TaxID=2047966 RepID=UPI000D3EA5E1|nr:hypothetical protein [Dongshaea marina]